MLIPGAETKKGSGVQLDAAVGSVGVASAKLKGGCIMRKTVGLLCVAVCAIGSFPIVTSVVGREQRESFKKLTLTADDIAEMTGVNIHKFQIDLPKGQKFSIIFRERESADAEPRHIYSFQFVKEDDELTTVRVGFIGEDRRLAGFLLGNERLAEFRVDCSGCSPSGLATAVPRPFANVEPALRTQLVSRSTEQAIIPGTNGYRLISLFVREPNKPLKDVHSFPRAELVLEKRE